jgi:hypothetical protein
MKSKSKKVGKRSKKQKGSKNTGSQKKPIVLNILSPALDPSFGPTILQVHDLTKLPLPGIATLVTLASSTPVLNVCSIVVDKCCSDADCGEAQTCANQYCVQQGCPQFTLTWTGQADHDYFVQAPSGIAISSFNCFDSISEGTWEGQDESSLVKIGNYVKNIYFPLNCSVTAGIYKFFVLGG